MISLAATSSSDIIQNQEEDIVEDIVENKEITKHVRHVEHIHHVNNWELANEEKNTTYIEKQREKFCHITQS